MFLRLPPVLRFLLAPIRSLPNINPTSVEALGKKDGWKWSKKVESSDSNSIAIRLSLDRSILEGNPGVATDWRTAIFKRDYIRKSRFIIRWIKFFSNESRLVGNRYKRGGNGMKIRYNWKRITGRTACSAN